MVDLDWSPELCDLFGVPVGTLPAVQPSNGQFGQTSEVPGLPDGVPILAVLADSHAALYGQGGTTVGLAKATYGTGSSVMTPTATFQAGRTAVPSTLAWLTDRPTYAREGNILSSGAALSWMAATLGLPGVAELTALAAEVPDSDGVVLVPAFSGLGAPYWDREVRAVLTGMTTSTTRAHLARAALDSVAHQICDVVEEIDVGPPDQGPPGRRRCDSVIAADADPGGPARAERSRWRTSPRSRPWVRPGWAGPGWAIEVPPVAATTILRRGCDRAGAPSGRGTSGGRRSHAPGPLRTEGR